MPMRICIYDDSAFRQFFPLSLTRSVSCLRAGIVPLFRRAGRHFEGAELTLVVREQLAAVTAEQVSDVPVNIIKRSSGSDVLFLNGRVRDFGNLPKLVGVAQQSSCFMQGAAVVAVLFKNEDLQAVPVLTTPDQYQSAFVALKEDINSLPTTASLYQYPWDLVCDIADEIAADCRGLGLDPAKPRHDGTIILGDQCYIDPSAIIDPGAVLDSRNGPVYLGPHVSVESFASVIGPAAVGERSMVLAGKLAQSSIGPVCRVGGEVEGSIFHAYVNKYHAGFIGHSYVGAWVNFGALTTNSDLKNNYSTIKVSVLGRMIDTGAIKVGSFVGDHTKFGIGTLLNTGISIGVCCNVFGGELTADKEVSSFRWGNTGNWEPYAVDKALETARRTTQRRKVQLSVQEEKLLQDIAAGVVSDQGVMRFE